MSDCWLAFAELPVRNETTIRLGVAQLAALCMLLFVLATASHGEAISTDALAAAARVEWQWDVKIPLRDGVLLSAILYKPTGRKEPRPCVFTLTPYIAQRNHSRGMYFASHGYPFLAIDVRGRGNSEGSFNPLIQEARDGYDIVEWLAKQSYCNGKIAMWGGSYAGYDQWATAKELPPHLATIVPVAAPTAGPSARNNLFSPYDLQWFVLTAGHTSQDKVFEDDAFWIGGYERAIKAGVAFRQLDTFFGIPSPVFQDWMKHPEVDNYWDAYNPSSGQYARMQLPTLTITGMYDGDQWGALAHYKGLMDAASPDVRARQYLVIGPWDHQGTGNPQQDVLGLHFGPASVIDLPNLHLEWYRFTMEGGAVPAFLKKQVAYYVGGAEHWRYADTLEAVTAEVQPFYLDSTGDGARGAFTAGSLNSVKQGHGAPDHYVYDPRDVSLASIESHSELNSLLDQDVSLADTSQVVYVSDRFEQDRELSGFFSFEAWISIDQPDTDFVVTVAEIGTDGTVTPLSTDQMRARYRETLRVQHLVNTKGPLHYSFNRFTFASRLVRKGCRLQLTLSAANSIQTERNYNSGGVVADETLKDARPVTVKLFHESGRPSALYIPIGAPETSNPLR